MVLSLEYIVTIVFFWFCFTIIPTGLLTRTSVVILCTLIQCILIVFSYLSSLVTFRREYFCIVELCSMLTYILVGTIVIIQDLIYYWLIGVTQSHQAYEWLDEVIHHMVLLKEQGIVY